MEVNKIETLLEEILKAIKMMDNKLEKLENRITNVEIQQNTIISKGKYPKYIKGTTKKLVEHIIL